MMALLVVFAIFHGLLSEAMGLIAGLEDDLFLVVIHAANLKPWLADNKTSASSEYLALSTGLCNLTMKPEPKNPVPSHKPPKPLAHYGP